MYIAIYTLTALDFTARRLLMMQSILTLYIVRRLLEVKVNKRWWET